MAHKELTRPSAINIGLVRLRLDRKRWIGEMSNFIFDQLRFLAP